MLANDGMVNFGVTVKESFGLFRSGERNPHGFRGGYGCGSTVLDEVNFINISVDFSEVGVKF